MSNRLVAFLVLLVTIIIAGGALYYIFVTRGTKLELHITPSNIESRVDVSYLNTPLTTTICSANCTISYPKKSGLSLSISASGYVSQTFDLSASPTSLNITLTKSQISLESLKQSISTGSALEERIAELSSRKQSSTGITFSGNTLTIIPQERGSKLIIENESVPLNISYKDILSVHRIAQDPNNINITTLQGLVRLSRGEDDMWKISSPHPIYRDILPYRDGIISLRGEQNKSLIEYKTSQATLLLGSYEDEILALDFVGDSLALLQKSGNWKTISLEATKSIIN